MAVESANDLFLKSKFKSLLHEADEERDFMVSDNDDHLGRKNLELEICGLRLQRDGNVKMQNFGLNNTSLINEVVFIEKDL